MWFNNGEKSFQVDLLAIQLQNALRLYRELLEGLLDRFIATPTSIPTIL